VSDPLWGNVTLLLPFDGAGGSTTITDESSLGNTVTLNGALAVSTAQSKFGGASIRMPTQASTTDYLTVPNSTSILNVASDFSIQFWYRLDASFTGSTGYLLTTYNDATGSGIDVYVGSLGATGARFSCDIFNASGGSVVGLQTDRLVTRDGTWHYLEVSRSGNTLYLFVDGSLEASGAISAGAVSDDPLIQICGSSDGFGSGYGWMDDLRLTNGAARNATSYTVPTTAHPTTGAVTSDARVQTPSLLGIPSALATVAAAVRAAIPGILGAPRAYALNDFSELVKDPSIRYVMRITGSPVSEIPVSSWQATRQTGALQYLQCVIPAVAQYLDLLAARRESSDFIVYRVGFAGAQEVESEMARAPLRSINVNSGPRRETATISGYAPAATDPVPPTTKSLTGIRSTFYSLGGESRVRCDIDWFLRPGQEVTAQGLTFTANYINYFVPSVGDAYMDVGSRG